MSFQSNRSNSPLANLYRPVGIKAVLAALTFAPADKLRSAKAR